MKIVIPLVVFTSFLISIEGYKSESCHLDQPHPSNCRKYYKCVNNKKRNTVCDNDKHFNPKLLKCQHPRLAACLVAASNDNSLITNTRHIISKDDKIIQDRDMDSDSNESNNGSESMESKESVGCIYKDPTTTTTKQSITPEITTSKIYTEGTTNDPITDKNYTSQSSNECAGINGEFVQFVSHENCSKYYVCDWGKLIEMNCPAGLHFNPILNVCDWPEHAGCGEGSSSSSTSSDKTTRSIETTPEYVSTTSSDLKEKCRNINGEFVQFVTHKNCSKYYVCDWGKLIEMNCPAGLHFNPILNVCDWPEHAGCGEGSSSISTSSDKTTRSIETTPEYVSTTSSDLKEKCRNINGEFVQFVTHENCSKYYVCDWGKLIEMNCPAGLHFNPILNVCDWPEHAGCGKGSSSSSTSSDKTTRSIETTPEYVSTTSSDLKEKCRNINGEFVQFVTHENCSKYYVCDWGKLIEMNCPDGLHFNPILNVCDWPEHAGCGKGSSSSSTSSDKTTRSIETTLEYVSTTSSDLKEKCRNINGEFVQFVTHENCSKYYVCDWGKLIEMNCPDGLHFNPILNVCDWPEHAGCGKDSSSISTSSDKTTGSIETTPEYVSTTSSDLKEKCPKINGEFVQFVTHENCSKYYVCDWGKLIEMNCPAGLHFNPILNVCDWPKHAGCGKGSSSSTSSDKTTRSVETTPVQSTPEYISTTSSDVKEKCPKINGEFVQFVTHENCSKYYVCDWGKLIEMNCPAGLHFNPIINVCDWPQHAGCGKGSSSSSISSDKTTRSIETTPEYVSTISSDLKEKCLNINGEFVQFVTHENCSKYYVCDWGKLIEMNCPDGLHFNPILNVCDWPEHAGCGKDSSSISTSSDKTTGSIETTPEYVSTTSSDLKEKCPKINGEFVQFVTHENCSKYYVCDWGKLIEMNCPAGLHFNPIINVCDWPQHAGCGKGSSSSNTSSDKTTRSIETTPEYVSTISSDLKEKCLNINGEFVQFVTHENCSKYYVCDWGKLIEMNCSAGLHFNTTLNVCDWPEHAGCGKDSSSISTSSDKTTRSIENTPEYVSTTSSDVKEKCPKINGEFVQFVTHENCSKYYVCDWGKLIEMNCPAGLHFNPTLNVCDWPEYAGCGKDSSSISTSSDKTTRSIETTPEYVSTTSSDVKEKCPKINGEFVQFVTHESCNKYYVCDWGKLIEMNCPAGLHFNPTLNVCDWPEHAGCGKDSSSISTSSDKTTRSIETTPENVSTTSSDVKEKCPKINGEFVQFVTHESCNKYYVCDWGKLIEMNCPAGLHFNPTLNVCDWPEHAGCGKDSSSISTSSEKTTRSIETTPEYVSTTSSDVKEKCPKINGEFVQFVTHENCSKYYVCDWGKLIEMNCPPGLHFNPIINVCDWPQHAGCGKGSSSSNTSSDKTTRSIETTPEYVSTISSDLKEKCLNINGEFVQFVTHENCSKYYVCDWGKLIEMNCPAGLHFNPILNVCDWPEHAGCGKDSSSISTSSDKTTRSIETTPEYVSTTLSDLKEKCPKINGEFVQFVTHENCSKYYVCDWGKLIEMNCPAGLHFNPIINVCDWPQHAGCGKGSSSSSTSSDKTTRSIETTPEYVSTISSDLKEKCLNINGEFVQFVTHENCSKYYVCDWGKLIEMNCPAGLHFNPIIYVCDWPQHAGCGKGSSSSSISSDKTTRSIETTPEYVSTISSDLKEKCLNINGEFVQFVTHENCSKYYVCDWGKLIEMNCPAGLHFNPILNVCDWPEHAGCGKDSSSISTSSDKTTRSIETTPEYVSTTSSDLKEKCRNINGEFVQFVTHKNCSKYYVCDWGKLIEMNCPAGLHFNPILNVCDWPEHAGCGKGSSSVSTSSDETTRSVETTPVETTPEYIGTTSSDLKEKCPKINGEFVQFVTHENCSKYYVCDWGKLIEMNCPAGLDFNPILNVCDWPEHAGCGKDSSSISTSSDKSTRSIETTPEYVSTTSSDLKEKCPKINGEFVQFVTHENCSKYYVCDWGKLIEMNCPAGLHFNPIINVCVWPQHAGCGKGSSSSSTSSDKTTRSIETTPEYVSTISSDLKEKCLNINGEFVQFVTHENCSKYYVCDWGKLIEMNCPAGLHFNPILNVCDWPEHAGCGKGSSSVSTSSDETTRSVEATPVETTPEYIGTTSSDLKEKCPKINGEFVQFVTHENCSKYYVCDWGKLIEMNCPAGLHFNPILNVCDWPEHAGCGKDSSSISTSSDKTTRSIETTPEYVSTTSSDLKEKCRNINGEFVQFVTHKNCSKYYVCDWGKLIEMNCPAGLHFNPILNVCDWPKHAGCGKGSSSSTGSDETTRSVETTPVQSTPEYISTTSSDVKEKCPKINGEFVQFVTHESCSKYYVCDWGKLIEMNCPAGLHFNPILNVCDWPENAGCVKDSSLSSIYSDKTNE